MTDDPRTTHRILARVEQMVRQTNRSIIDPMLPEISVEGLKPVVATTARMRGIYLEKFFEVAQNCEDGHPTAEEIHHLKQLREAYMEMVEGIHALEVAIERGYVSVID